VYDGAVARTERNARAVPFATACLAALALGCNASPERLTAHNGVVTGRDGGAAPTDAAPVVPPGRLLFARWNALEAALAMGVDWSGERRPKRVSSALAHDLDDDGVPEVMLNDNQEIYDRSLRFGDTRLFRRGAGGAWGPGEALPGGVHGCRLAADLDGDGRVDLLCSSPETAVYWDVSRGIDLARRTVIAPVTVVMAASVWDIDEDGLLDIVLSRWMSSLGVFRGLGGRRYEDVSARWGLDTEGMTWQVAYVDLDRDGRDDLFVANDGNAHENITFRALGPGADGEPGFARYNPMPVLDPGERDALFGISNRSPMGYALGDIDGDGAQEFVLADLSPSTVLGPDPRTGWRSMNATLGLARELTTSGQQLIPWSPRLWDIDHDGLLELLIPCGDDDGFTMMPNRGNSIPLLYAGAAGGRFVPQHTAAGFSEGHAANVTLGDLDGDGDLDVLMGGFGQPEKIYRNDTVPSGGHMLLTLRGSVSNPAGLGARVEVHAGALRRAFVYGSHGAPQVTDAPTLDVPTGSAAVLDEVIVRWPSGLVRRWTNLPVGASATLEEPAALTIDPPSRRVPADGTSTVTVTVRPVNEAGAPRRAASVTIGSLSSTAAWVGPTQVDADGVATRVLRAPATPGSDVIVVTVDGTPWRVRPRVWFGA